MRWFTDEVATSDRAWDRALSAYAAHLADLAPRLPADLRQLASDPRFDLHDGRFERLGVDLDGRRVAMDIIVGDLAAGYRRLDLRFEDASVVPDDLSSLADAVGATFRPNHWHRRRTVTEIRWQEFDLEPDGRFVLRLRLTPFHEFAVEFGRMSMSEVPLDSRPTPRPGVFERIDRAD